jgi:hypothetical protein
MADVRQNFGGHPPQNQKKYYIRLKRIFKTK